MPSLHSFRAARVLAGMAAAGALLLSPATTLPAAAAPAPAATPALSSVGLCGSPQAGHRACMVRVVTANGKRVTTRLSNTAPSSGYSPADVQSAYGIGGSSGGSNQTVAVIDAYDNPNAEADLALYRTTWNLPPCTTANGCFRKTNQSGGASPLPPAASTTNRNDPSYGWGSEIDLDIQAVSAACPLCHILLIEGASSADSDFMASIATAPSLGASELSLSWGGCESPSG